MSKLLLPEHIWRPINKWENLYHACTDGQIKSLPKKIIRKNGKPQTFKGKVLTQNKSGDGYTKITFSHLQERTEASVHIVIWITFKGAIPEGMEINHKNGIKSDNRLINLELVTHSQNIIHSYEILKRPKPYELKKRSLQNA